MSDQAVAERAERARGTVYRSTDGTHLVVRLTLPGGRKSKPVHLPPGIKESEAREAAAKLHDLSRERLRAAAPKPAEAAWDAWVKRWFAHRIERGQTSVRQDEGRWWKWISPEIGTKLPAETTTQDMESLVRRLDRAQQRGEIRSKTALLTWGVMKSAIKAARLSKELGLRVLTHNPGLEVIGPDRSPERVGAWLYPVEASQLFACELVPVRWRRLVALAIGLYLRPNELKALACSAVDLLGGVVNVYRAVDPTKADKTKQTKTGLVRRVPIDPAIRPLVEVLLREARAAGRDKLVTLPPDSDLAEGLRDYLRRAGVTRDELFADDDARRPITWRYLRATGITWRALRGDGALAVQRGAGHRSLTTTQKYIREADDVGLGVGQPFPALPQALLDSDTPPDMGALCDAGRALNEGEMLSVPSGIRTPGDGSKTSPPRKNPQVWTPIGAVDTQAAQELAAAVSRSDTLPLPPLDLVDLSCEMAWRAIQAFDRGDLATARRCWREMGDVLRFRSEAGRRGTPRFVTYQKRTQTVSAWARELGWSSQALTYRLDTLPLPTALRPREEEPDRQRVATSRIDGAAMLRAAVAKERAA